MSSLAFTTPMDAWWVLDFLGAHAVPGVERYEHGTYTRVFPAPRGPALISVAVRNDAVDCRLRTSDRRDADVVEQAVRQLLDLDADSRAVDADLARDTALAPLVARRPGLRCPGSLDGFETAVRTIIGQQISVSGARTVVGRIVAEHGRPVFDEWVLFPDATTLAAVDPVTLPMPRARGRSVVALAAAVRDGLDLATAPRADLLALPGVGPWTADYLRMRIGGDRDVLLASDLVVRRSAESLGIDLSDGRSLWAPWRSYATYHLWAHVVAERWAASR